MGNREKASGELPGRSPGHATTFLFDLLIHGSVYIAIEAVAMVFVTSSLLGVVDPRPALIVALAAFSVYAVDRVWDVDHEDAVNVPDRTTFLQGRETLFLGIAVVSYLISLVLAWNNGLAVLGIAVVPGIATLLYTVEWVPGSGSSRIKDVFIVNTVWVAVAWAVTVTYAPLAVAGATPGGTAAVVCAYFVLRITIGGEINNMRDVVGDRREGVATLPVVVGEVTARRLLLGLEFASLGLVLGSGVTGVLPWEAVFVFLPNTLVTTTIVWSLGRDIDHELLATVRTIEHPMLAAVVLIVL